MKQSNEVVVKEELNLPAELVGMEWGATNDLDDTFKNDIIIPKLMCVNALSKIRKAKLADEGDLVNSVTNEVLSNGKEPLNFVVVNTFKRWQKFTIDSKGDKTFVNSEIVTLQNAGYAYEGIENGKKYKRRQVLSFTILLQKDLERGNKVPYVLDFKSGDKKAGRLILTIIKQMKDSAKKLPSPAALFALTTMEETFPNGKTAFVKNASLIGSSSVNIIKIAYEVWKDLDIKKDQIEIDENDVLGEDETV